MHPTNLVTIEPITIRLARSPLREDERTGTTTARQWAADLGDATPTWEASEVHRGVRIDVADTIYEVVPVEHEGRLAALYFAEMARTGVLSNDNDAAPMPRQYLLHIAAAALRDAAARGHDGFWIAIEDGPRIRPDKRRPDDETLLKVVRQALAGKVPARRVLAAAYGVSTYTADDWLRHARKLPNNGLPPAKRGRPRKEKP